VAVIGCHYRELVGYEGDMRKTRFTEEQIVGVPRLSPTSTRPRLSPALLLLTTLALSACTGPRSALRPFNGVWDVGCAPGVTPIELTYLGAGGFVMRRGGHAIMTAPFYSNPSLSRVGLGLPIEPDLARIDARLPDIHDVDAILVGHAHYDHLMDAVHVAECRAPSRSILYGNETMLHLLAARPALWDRVVSLETDAGDWTRPGTWHYVGGGSIRFMALRSEHAPHFLGIGLFRGEVRKVQTRLPRTAYGWRQGQVFAFLIDFLAADGSVDLRIHYQDAATNPPAGFPPASESGTRVDVAILCVASFEQVHGYPEAIINRTRPRVVLLGHWENFFHRPEPEPCPVPLTDTKQFARRLAAAVGEAGTGSEWHAPLPGAVLRLCPKR
jgi:hypothetical protein